MAAEKRVQGLDGVRAAAAAYVVLAHVLLARVPFFGQGPGGWLLAAGQEAVIVFFLLSGAVIRFSVEARGGMDDGFLPRRFIRLFPVLLLGLALGYLSEAAAMRGWPAADWGRLAGNLGFLQDFEPVKPGVLCSTYYSNSPLWSLSYEWWFYVLFFVVWRKVAEGWRTHVAGLISVAAWVGCFFHPGAVGYWAGYFMLWWTGGVFAGADAAERRRALGWLAAATALTLANAGWAGWQGAGLRPGVYPVLPARHHVFALAAMTAWWFFSKHRPGILAAGAGILARLAWIAPYSYALYVLHLPIAGSGNWLQGGQGGGFLFLAAGAALLAALVWWAERVYHPWAAERLNRLLRRA